jgi:hypothetical protein
MLLQWMAVLLSVACAQRREFLDEGGNFAEPVMASLL